MNWKQQSYDHKLYHDDDGKVWGYVQKFIGSCEYTATYNGTVLGQYIGMTEAQIAIEKAHKNRNRIAVKKDDRSLPSTPR